MERPPKDPVNYELSEGDLSGDYDAFLDMLTDVPASPALQPLPINQAGITNQQAYVQIADIGNNGVIKPVLCDIQIGVTLDNHRGIHMSRCGEAIIEVQATPHESVDAFAINLARVVRDKQKSRGSVVKVSGIYMHDHKTHVSNRVSHDKMFLLSDAEIDGDAEHLRTGLSAYNLTACPCTRTHTKYSVVPALKEAGFNLEEIKTILKTTLSGTHTQRGTISIIIDKNSSQITTGELFKILDNSAHLVFELLKRPDEHDLVVRALQRPQFTEDVTREVVVNAFDRFSNDVPGETTIEVESILQDSIHIHDVCTKISTRFESIRKALSHDSQ